MKQDDRIIDPTQEIWVAGHNDVGYSPDPDNVTAFATQEAARDYIADEIERVADGLDAVAWDTDEPDELANGAHADAENVRHNADQDYGKEFSIHVEDGRSLPTSFWVQRSTLGARYADVEGELDLDALDKDEEFQRLLDELPEVGEVYITATSNTPVYDAENDEVYSEERHGWIDPQWSRVYLHPEMTDVRPLWTGTDPAEAAEAIKNYVGSIEPSDSDYRGSRGTYYGSDGEQDSDVTFTYAAHIWGWPEDKVRELDGHVFSTQEQAIRPETLDALRVSREEFEPHLRGETDDPGRLQARLDCIQQEERARGRARI